MTYKFSITAERVPYLVEELKEKIVVGEAKDERIEVEITIEDNIDVLRTFHAGINCGMRHMVRTA
jgi:hypothetical protein